MELLVECQEGAGVERGGLGVLWLESQEEEDSEVSWLMTEIQGKHFSKDPLL